MTKDEIQKVQCPDVKYQSKPGSRCLSTIFDRDPYRSMIEKQQFQQLKDYHFHRVNHIRSVLGGKLISRKCVDKQLQYYLTTRGLSVADQ